MTVRVLGGDALEQLSTLPAESVQCCVTSPPYFGLRDYGTAQWEGGDATCDHEAARSRTRFDYALADKQASNAGSDVKAYGRACPCGAVRIDAQIGLEDSPEAYVERLVAVFREVRRVLHSSGTLWLVLGDSYAGSWGNQGRKPDRGTQRPINGPMLQRFEPYPAQESGTGAIPSSWGVKPKDLIGIPWMVAFALRADGWYLRSDIIWSKKAPMPESVTDRPTKAHEYVFMFAKQARYFYDAPAIAEPMEGSSLARMAQTTFWTQRGGPKDYGTAGINGNRSARHALENLAANGATTRNKRSVWHLGPEPYAEAHFATFPTALVEPCILAGARPGDMVLDPFAGSGTVGLVATRHRRDSILIELNPAYIDLIHRRLHAVQQTLPLERAAL